MHCTSFGKKTRHFYRKLGVYIGKHPIPFIVGPVIFSLLLAIGILKFYYVQDADYLYNPINSRANKERKMIDKLFPLNKTGNFDPGRLTDLGRFGWLIIYPEDGGTVLRKSFFDKLIYIDKMVKNISINYNGEKLFFKDLCAKIKGECYRNEIFSLSRNIKEIDRKRAFVKYPVDLNKEHFTFKFYASNIGDVEVDHLNYITSAKVVRLLYFLNEHGEDNLRKCDDWETTFLNKMKDFTFPGVELYYFVSSSIEREVNRTVIELVPYYVLLIFVMLVFSVLAMLTNDWIKSKPWLGVSSTISTLLAIATSLGFMMLCGLPFIDLVVAIPFLLLGIGLDDTFVITAAWRQTNPSKKLEERIGDCLSEASVSITITSLTNFFSFMFGFMTPFPSVRIFCSFAATGIVFTYIYQICFFTGTLALCGKAEEMKLHSLFFVPIKSSWKNDKNIILKLLCCTKNDVQNNEASIKDFFRDIIGRYLTKKTFVFGIIIIYFGYLAMAVWGFLQLKEGTELHMFAPYDSYVIGFIIKFFKDFRQYRDRIQLVIPITLNYADPTVRDKVENVLQKFEDSPHIAKGDLTESWLRYYTSFQNDPQAFQYFQNYNMSNKEDYIDRLRNVFFHIPAAERFISDIKFNHNYTDIVASRFLIQTTEMGEFNEGKHVLVELRKIADNAPFPILMSHFFFSFYDQFLMITSVVIQTLLTCGSVMLILILIFIPDIRCFIVGLLNMISIEIGVIGFMSLWNVHLDTVSMLLLITCIGFSVDYISHMTTSYLKCEEISSVEKVKQALHAVGLPILQGSLSTVLGVIVILVCPNYIFLCFLKIVCILIIISAFHSIFLLPLLFVFLDYILPKCTCKTNNLSQPNTRTFYSYIGTVQQLSEENKLCESSKKSNFA